MATLKRQMVKKSPLLLPEWGIKARHSSLARNVLILPFIFLGAVSFGVWRPLQAQGFQRQRLYD